MSIIYDLIPFKILKKSRNHEQLSVQITRLKVKEGGYPIPVSIYVYIDMSNIRNMGSWQYKHVPSQGVWFSPVLIKIGYRF